MSNVTIQHFPAARGTLGFLDPSLEAMGQVMDRYIDFFLDICPGDVPYSYTERATLSQFAGGVWLSNPANLVLEEYKSEKAWEEGDDKGIYKGRGDIWFLIGDKLCYAEAKRADFGLSPGARPDFAEMLAVLRSDCEQAHKSSEKDRELRYTTHPMGMLFVRAGTGSRFATTANKRLDEFESALSDELRHLTANERYDAVWSRYFRPDLLEEPRWLKGDDGLFWSYPALETIVCIKNDYEYG